MDIQNTTYTSEKVKEKKDKQSWSWVNSKHKKGGVCDTFVQLSEHLQAIACVYSSEIPTKSPGMLTHRLTLANPASETTHPSSRLLTALLSPLLCFASFSVLSSGTFLLSSSFGLVGNIARNPFVWVLRQNRQRNLLALTHTHTTNAQHHVTHPSLTFTMDEEKDNQLLVYIESLRSLACI